MGSYCYQTGNLGMTQESSCGNVLRHHQSDNLEPQDWDLLWRYKPLGIWNRTWLMNPIVIYLTSSTGEPHMPRKPQQKAVVVTRWLPGSAHSLACFASTIGRNHDSVSVTSYQILETVGTQQSFCIKREKHCLQILPGETVPCSRWRLLM